MWLLPEKAAFLTDEDALLIADLHLGKINHFRMAGIAVPNGANERNLEKLIELISRIKPGKVIFLGDLFHSTYNSEWEAVGQVVKHFRSIQFYLVRGNHDIMSELQYKRHTIEVVEEMRLGPFLLTHELLEEQDPDHYNLSGHVHPGVRLLGKGRQSLVLPCFYFAKNYGLLPAFGTFTGLARLKVETNSQVYLVAENKVLEMEHG